MEMNGNGEEIYCLIEKYFPKLPESALSKLRELYPLYSEWNGKINVISRKDIEMLYLHHVLHSLAIAKYMSFSPGETVLDVGTGGGFPGIPLAILFPESRFTLIDSIGKKIRVVEEISAALSLKNVRAVKMRAEEMNEVFTYVVSRAVTNLQSFIPWVKGKYAKGILYLKGGDLTENESFALRGKLRQEIDIAAKRCGIKRELIKIVDITEFFQEEYFKEKRIIHIARAGNMS